MSKRLPTKQMCMRMDVRVLALIQERAGLERRSVTRLIELAIEYMLDSPEEFGDWQEARLRHQTEKWDRFIGGRTGGQRSDPDALAGVSGEGQEESC